jgi:2-polyprenyl-6-methoxyphenol hydroxylase-like FAD-dependent oxidoreductase
VSNRGTRAAVIIGGSMGGLFAALLLRRAGWIVDVFERGNVELSGRGAGIVTHAELCAVLKEAGLDPTKDLGVAVQGRKTLDFPGRVIASYECPQVVTSWDRVFRMLRGAFPPERYHLGKEMKGIELGEQSVVAHFADGTHAAGQVLVGADGFRSTVRGQILPEVQPCSAGYVAWRGLVDEGEFSDKARRDLFDCLAFCLPPREQMLGYPVAGPENDLREGHRRYNFVWYRPANDAQLENLLTDQSGHRHPISIPPTLVRKDVVDELREAARRLLAPQLQEAINLTPQPFLQPIYDVETPQMAVGRVAILGDAAFVGRPHVAAGVTKAAEDAMALATALQGSDDVVKALQSFERARMQTNRLIVERGRDLGVYLQPELRNDEELRRAAEHHTPQAVMSEIAILDFLRR